MAEFVSYRSEEWISELELLERINLFSHEQVKNIASKRRSFEYKLQARTKCKEDYLNYIQYEVDLLKLIKAKRDLTGQNLKKAEIDYSLATRIQRLFKYVIFRFQYDIKLWMTYFSFCKELQFFSAADAMMIKMVQLHHDKPKLFKFAASWMLEEVKSVENARFFLLKGLRYHPRCSFLYEELLKVELEYMQSKKEEGYGREETGEDVVNGELVEAVFDSAVHEIKNIQIIVDLLNMTSVYPDTKQLQLKMLRYLKDNYPTAELTWDTLARREKRGLINTNNKELNEQLKVLPSEERILRSVNTFKEGLMGNPSAAMWEYYLDYLIEIQLECETGMAIIPQQDLLRDGMEGAMASGVMTEKHYKYWLNYLLNNKLKQKSLFSVFQSAIKDHPSSVEMWTLWLKYHVALNQENDMISVFYNAMRHLKTDSIFPIWEMVFKRMISKSSSRTDEFFRETSNMNRDLGNKVRPIYLEWLVEKDGIVTARRKFETSEFQHPPSLAVIQKMIQLEQLQPEMCTVSIRHCHELAVHYFGEENADVWLQYVEFELKSGDAARICSLYQRATKALVASVVDVFTTKFSRFNIRLSEI